MLPTRTHHAARTLAIAAALIATPALFPAPTRAADTPDASPAAHPAPLHVIPFQTISNWIVVPVRVNGSRPLRCILDTGMPEGLFVFDPGVGAEIDLSYVTSTPVKGVGPETQTANVAMGLTLEAADLTAEKQNAYVLSTKTELATYGVDAAIGATLFNHFAVAIDFDASTISLYDPATYEPDEGTHAIPLTLSRTKPFIHATIQIDDREPVDAALLLDTGDTGTIELFSNSNDALRPPAVAHALTVAGGVGGDVPGHVGRATSVTIAGLTLHDVVASFSEDARNANGSIGIDLLRRFNPVIDYPNTRLILTPAPDFHKPFEFNMAGLALRPREGGKLVVHSVLPDTPAARADIKPGDVITAIDDHPCDNPDDTDARERLEQPGKTITLTLDRQGATISVSLTLERLI